jgi:hypothetical protein
VRLDGPKIKAHTEQASKKRGGGEKRGEEGNKSEKESFLHVPG